MLSAVGAPIEKILQCVTVNPARALGVSSRAGALKPGMPADITVLDIIDYDKILTDQYGNQIPGKKLFIPLLTMISGRIAYRQIFF